MPAKPNITAFRFILGPFLNHSGANPSQSHFGARQIDYGWLVFTILGASGHGNVHIYIAKFNSTKKVFLFLDIFAQAQHRRQRDFAFTLLDK